MRRLLKTSRFQILFWHAYIHPLNMLNSKSRREWNHFENRWAPRYNSIETVSCVTSKGTVCESFRLIALIISVLNSDFNSWNLCCNINSKIHVCSTDGISKDFREIYYVNEFGYRICPVLTWTVRAVRAVGDRRTRLSI